MHAPVPPSTLVLHVRLPPQLFPMQSPDEAHPHVPPPVTGWQSVPGSQDMPQLLHMPPPFPHWLMFVPRTQVGGPPPWLQQPPLHGLPGLHDVRHQPFCPPPIWHA
jgi:hypothetical protein